MYDVTKKAANSSKEGGAAGKEAKEIEACSADDLGYAYLFVQHKLFGIRDGCTGRTICDAGGF